MKRWAFVAMLWMAGTLGAEEAWKPLFEKDLSNAEYAPEVWSITADGELTAASDGPIWSKSEYENFELSLEFRADARTNSGVLVYATNKVDWIPGTVEFQIYGGQDSEDGVPTVHDCGAIYGHVPPAKLAVKKPGEWNSMRVKCVGKKIACWLNGEKVSEADLSQYTSAKKNPDGSDIPEWLTVPKAEIPTKGFVGLQGKHGHSVIFFRNVQIRPVVAK